MATRGDLCEEIAARRGLDLAELAPSLFPDLTISVALGL